MQLPVSSRIRSHSSSSSSRGKFRRLQQRKLGCRAVTMQMLRLGPILAVQLVVVVLLQQQQQQQRVLMLLPLQL